MLFYCEALDDLTETQIQHGFAQAKRNLGAFFPSIAQLREWCESWRPSGAQAGLDGYVVHQWQASDCKLCHGEGRLCITWTMLPRQDAHIPDKWALTQIIAYSEQAGMKRGSHEYPSVYRCSCPAGELPTIPRRWPRFSKSMNPIRERR